MCSYNKQSLSRGDEGPAWDPLPFQGGGKAWLCPGCPGLCGGKAKCLSLFISSSLETPEGSSAAECLNAAPV